MNAVPKKEGIDIEFKSDVKKLPDKDLVDAVVAMSNTKGGTLYLGVEDDGTPTGVHKDHRDTTKLAALIANKTMPPVSVRVLNLFLANDGSLSDGGTQVAAVEVAASKAIIASADGRIMRRRLKADGTPESVPLYPYEVITRLSSIGQLDYSAFPVPDSTLDDIDPKEIQRLRNILTDNHGGDQALLELGDVELLGALQMVTTVNNELTPTITGLLLAGRQEAIKRAIPASGASFQVLDGTEVRVNRDIEAPLLYTIEKIREMLEPWNPEREYEQGLFRRSIPEFDRRAFREALVNAFGHRDYALLGAVRVLVDEEGLTISNPGGFIEGVTLDNLLTVEPHSRNQCLMNALKRVGLAEKTGRGVDRIFEGSLIYGRPLPDYSGSTGNSVSVFIARSAPDETFMRMIGQEQESSGKPLSLRALLVLDALKHQRRLTVKDLASQLHFTEPVMRATAEFLVEIGIVEARGASTSRTYILDSKMYAGPGKAVKYIHQSDIDSIRYPELILKLAKKQGGKITRKDVEELLRIPEKQAYRQIIKLVNSGRLAKRGSGSASYYELLDS